MTKANDYNNGPQLNTKQWSDWRKYMLTHGTYDPNEWDKLDYYQKEWTRDTLNTLKALNESP